MGFSLKDDHASDDDQIIHNTDAKEDISFIDTGKEGSSFEPELFDVNNLHDYIRVSFAIMISKEFSCELSLKYVLLQKPISSRQCKPWNISGNFLGLATIPFAFRPF